MTDEELNIRLRDLGIYSADMAADRIENLLTEQSNLVVAAHRQGYDQARAVSSELRRAMADRIEALTKRLTAMGEQADKDMAFIGDYIIANGNLLAERDALEAKLAKAVRLLRATRSRLNRSPFDLFLELDAFLAEQGENP